jgi:N4-gp56 family major capsid protein
MANTTVSSGNTAKRFMRDFFVEYVRDNRMSKFAGTNPNNIIQVKEGSEKVISIPLVTRLKGSGVTGSQRLTGNEEAIGNYNWDMATTYRRHGVRLDKEEREKSEFDMMMAAKPLLKNWALEDLRNQYLDAFCAVYNGTTYSAIDSATAGIRNTWNANNSDRVLYGAVTSNYNATFATALANVDSTNDKLSPDMIDLAKNIAQTADPFIRPVQVGEDDEYFVMLVGSTAMYHLRNNSVMLQANRDARERNINNPLFRGGDLMWDNVLIREVPEITRRFSANAASLFATGGNSSTAAEPAFLCGAQALAWAIGQRPDFTTDNTDDYGFRPGVAIEKKELVNKLFFNNKQHGMVSVFVSGVR